jgi:hypothetical protein
MLSLTDRCSKLCLLKERTSLYSILAGEFSCLLSTDNLKLSSRSLNGLARVPRRRKSRYRNAGNIMMCPEVQLPCRVNESEPDKKSSMVAFFPDLMDASVLSSG